MKLLKYSLSVAVLASIVFAACVPIQRPAPSAEITAATGSWAPPKGALVSIKVTESPQLDGVMDDTVWQGAEPLAIEVKGGANMGKTMAELRSVYTDDMVYFLLTYVDPTESQQRSPWKLGEDGKWTKLSDPEDKGGDNNTYYEDKFSLMWPINNSVAKFESKGCFVACHTKDDTGKPYGNKFFENPGETADLWHWKSVRNLINWMINMSIQHHTTRRSSQKLVAIVIQRTAVDMSRM